MKILFVTFGEVSVGRGGARACAMLRALADAGYQVDVLSQACELSAHSNVSCLNDHCNIALSRRQLKIKTLKTISQHKYDVVHAVDEAVFFVARICRMKKIPFIYDAVRCFSGPVGQPAARGWRIFSRFYGQLEQKVIKQARYVLSPCDTMTSDLSHLVPDVDIFQIEDVPIQSLIPSKEIDEVTLESYFEEKMTSLVVCCVLPGNVKELKKVMMAARKVVDSIPAAAFIFRGALAEECRKMAANLDLLSHCAFLHDHEAAAFVAALEQANVALLLSGRRDRYVHPEVFTLLNSAAPLIAVQDEAYEKLLSDKNCIPVLSSTDSIKDGVLRVLKEPLFSVQVATEGQQLVADKYSFSSFKHKVRMLYHEILNEA